jgi:hypothetical protein
VDTRQVTSRRFLIIEFIEPKLERSTDVSRSILAVEIETRSLLFKASERARCD